MFILVNLKGYNCEPTAVARAAVEASADGTTIAIAPQTAHLGAVAETGVETWAQHVAPVEAGSHTGSTLATAAADAGGSGTLLNHSECRLTLADLDDAISAAESAGLDTVACANTPNQIAAVTALGPDAVAIEPPALIGTGTPVSKADPDIVRDAVAAARDVDESVPVYCGAGISTSEDVVAARELGAEGVLLASGVAKDADPQSALEGLVESL